jgi:hypothetical protein
MPRSRSAFTLFEVGISLALISMAVITVMMLLPLGIKAQKNARYQLYASAKANELIENFSQCTMDFRRNHSDDLVMAGLTSTPINNGWMTQTLHLFNSLGQFDLERIAVNATQGNYPVPTAIARRLDSAGDEIQKVLDAGGQIYYCDPNPIKFTSAGASSIGANEDEAPELQRLVWAVTGYAQQDCLPFDPVEQQPNQMWPFPPQSGGPLSINRQFYTSDNFYFTTKNFWWDSGKQAWIELSSSTDPRWNAGENKLGKWIYHKINASISARPTSTNWEQATYGGLLTNHVHGDQDASWEWYAFSDLRNGMTEASSVWMAGLKEYRRLAHAHYGRIRHQISPTLRANGPEVPKADAPYAGGFFWKDDFPANFHSWVDGSGARVPKHEDGTYFPPPSSNTSAVGYPAPAYGLPTSIWRGTDILNEDHETFNFEMLDQYRAGMPSLERRVMYRTAALVLWAKVQSPTIPKDEKNPSNNQPGFISGPIDILKHPLSVIGTAADADAAWNPNVADNLGLLPPAQNPLVQVIDPPCPKDIHPAQVLALSYLAHAAMMVTGYQPPFIHDGKTPEPMDDTDIDPDETQPYKLLTYDTYNLWDVYDHEGRDVAGGIPSPGPDDDKTPAIGDAYQPRPYCPEQPLDPLPDAAWTLTSPVGLFFERTIDNQKITYHRLWGRVINPNPPPYADRDAFDMAGKKLYSYSESVEAMLDEAGVQQYEPPVPFGGTPTALNVPRNCIRRTIAKMPVTHNDTVWARNAHETFMRWAMAYISENPYDFIVPRPFNRQVMSDRPLFSWQLFDPAEKAMRTKGSNARYLSIFGSDRARFCMYPNMQFYAFPWVDSVFSEMWRRRDGKAAGPSVPLPAPTGVNPQLAGTTARRGLTRPGYQFGGYIEPLDTVPANSSQFYKPVEMNYYREQFHGLDLDPGGIVALKPVPTPVKIAKAKGSDGNPFWWYNDAFEAADRCRQIVFWNVGWKEYEDAESQPSAAIDASHLGRMLGGSTNGLQSGAFQFNFFGKLVGNPEQNYVWANPEHDGTLDHWPAGKTVKPAADTSINTGWMGDVYDARHPGIFYARAPMYYHINDEQWSPFWTLGYWGADRNHNGKFDQGKVKSHVRMRASEVIRFNYYDPVAWTTVRN